MLFLARFTMKLKTENVSHYFIRTKKKNKLKRNE